jgi:predicted dehydrogenase
MDMVRIGVIGCGVIGNTHLKVLSTLPAARVVAVADLIEERARTAGTQYGIKGVYTSAEALLADGDVEAVILAIPACERLPIALSAYAKRRHVLTEKPVAMCAADVRRMIAARGDLISGCCSSRFRHFKSAEAATGVVASGALGALRVVHCRAVREAGGPPSQPPPEWRLKKALNAGGILTNWGCYDLDYLLGITGWNLVPRRVFAQVWTVPEAFIPHVAPGSDAETHGLAFILCEGGTVISFERAEYMALKTEEAWRIVGSDGSLRLTMAPGKGNTVLLDRASTEKGIVTSTVWQGDEDWNGMHTSVDADFVAAVREKRQPKTSLEQALVVAQITDAIYASAATGLAREIGG